MMTFVGLIDQSMGELWSPVTNIGGRSLQKGGSSCGSSVVVRIG